MVPVASDSTVATADSIPVIPELQRLQLQNLVLQQQLCREQMNVLVLQYLQGREAQQLRKRIDDLTKQINEFAERVFIEQGLDAQRHQLDVQRGVFVNR